ncbi:MAG: diguanylate cyclase [Rhodocyclaceae bacterium]|nr:diguanylate cyclase [Rhodocyclaceae bacterium]MDZ4214154.1 diguanylate cyclase [Rhodocyclaceae bacterium]
MTQHAALPYRTIVFAIYLLVALMASLSLHYSLREIDQDIANIARERGAILFRLIELTRDWNARHGGVYAPVTEANQPNPYLKHPQRDITDQHGRQLTMVNPAFMTRQIAEIAEMDEGVHFHITSLNPIRPANEADAWETESLTLFEKSALKERLDYFADGGSVLPGPAHRYMAPLIVKPACMKCHDFQGYQLGDIRGGISVSMPAEKLMVIAEERRKQAMGLYLIGFLIVAGLGHLVAWRTHRHLALLESINREQEGVIAERNQELSEAEKEQLIASAVFDNANEAIFVTDRDNKILRINPSFTAMTGYTPLEAIGQDPGLLKSGRHDAAFFTEMWRHLNEVGHWEGEIWNRRKNGEVFAAWLAITTIQGEAAAGRHVASAIDITKRKEAEEIILRRANYDKLTQLPNRSLFDDRLISVLAMARRHRRSFALMYIDIDWFKNVNDTLGHAAGDALLSQAAERMEKCVREADTVARLGGDEFAVILSDLNNANETHEVADRINRALVETFDLNEGSCQVSCSIGIAIYPQDGTSELLIKKAADQALYAAKGAGRNTYRMASPA